VRCAAFVSLPVRADFLLQAVPSPLYPLLTRRQQGIYTTQDTAGGGSPTILGGSEGRCLFFPPRTSFFVSLFFYLFLERNPFPFLQIEVLPPLITFFSGLPDICFLLGLGAGGSWKNVHGDLPFCITPASLARFSCFPLPSDLPPFFQPGTLPLHSFSTAGHFL